MTNAERKLLAWVAQRLLDRSDLTDRYLDPELVEARRMLKELEATITKGGNTP